MPDSKRAERRDRLEERSLLRERAARYARREATVEVRTVDVVAFRRGTGRYAIALSSLREIRPLGGLCLVPFASPVVPGVFQYRGELVSAHDLAIFMGSARPASAEWVLVVEELGRRLGLLADEIDGVEPIADRDRRPLPLGLGDLRAVFNAIYERTLILEGNALFETPAFYRAF